MDIDFDKVINKNCLLAWRWAPMCDAVRRSPVISDGAKILYNEIVSFIWQKDEVRAWPNQSTLGDNLSLSRQAISRRLKELESVGLIGVHRNGFGKSSDLYLYELDLERLQVKQNDIGMFKPVPVEQVLSSSCSTLDTNEVSEDMPSASYPQVIHRQNDAVLNHETELSPKVNGVEPVVVPDVTIPLHQDVTEVEHQDVTEVEHQDVTSAPQLVNAEGALDSDIEGVSEDGDFSEEETGNIINSEEESVAPKTDISTSPVEAKPDYPTIHRRDIPKDLILTWNSALTEESVVIDGRRYVILDDDKLAASETETLEINDALQNPETVEAEVGNSEIDVNRGKMAKLVGNIGNAMTTKADNANNGVAAARMLHVEMRAKLDEMDRLDAEGFTQSDSTANTVPEVDVVSDDA